eukprot:TRINITY_DN997_c0_g4_i1.p1 TRINITY_DN997_c0_g4~~TRINITY_DN997_c0_g4_i1.p1  ORF type:complete len:1552 (+),score=442.93 TRINITY_DN997_c0_g4_i1:2334-6989(+)
MQAGVMPFSFAYLAAEALNSGWIRFLLPSIQSDTSTHLLPSHCWILTLPEPSWFSQEVLISGSRPVAPRAFRRASVMLRFSRPQRTCSPLMTLPLPNLSWAVRTASTVAIAAETPRLQRMEPSLFLSCMLPRPAPQTTLSISAITGTSLPATFQVADRQPLAASPAGMVSSSEPAHQEPMILSRANPTFCAAFSAVWFITPQPQKITQSGFSWRMRSHCAPCSLPGCATGISTSLNLPMEDSACSATMGSLPQAESWYRNTIFLPASEPPFLVARYLTMAETCIWQVVTSGKAYGNTEPSTASVRPQPIISSGTLSSAVLSIRAQEIPVAIGLMAVPWVTVFLFFMRSQHSTPLALLYSVSHSSQESLTPLTPPSLRLTQFRQSTQPPQQDWPLVPYGPTRQLGMAMNWSLVCASAGTAADSRPAAQAVASSSCLRCLMLFMVSSPLCCRCRLLSGTGVPALPTLNRRCAASVRERPQAQFFLGDLPQPGQSVRLGDEEEDDQRAEHHQLDMRHRGVGERQVQQLGQRWQGVVQEDRQQQDEGRAQEGPEDAAHTADDDHEQDAEGQVQRKAVRFHRAQVAEGVKRTGHATVEGAHRKGRQLGAYQGNADHLGGHIHVAHRHPGAAGGRAHQVLGHQGQHADDGQHEEILAHRRIDGQAEEIDLGCADHARGTVIGEPGELGQRPHHEELRGQRRHGQVEALDTQRRQPEQHTHQGCAAAREQQRGHDGDALDTQLEVVGRISAHGHEGGRAQRELAGVAGQHVQAQCGQGKHQERHQDGREPVFVAKQGHAQEGEGHEQREDDPVLADREDLAVGQVSGLELSGFTVQHCILLVAGLNSPFGLSSRPGRRIEACAPAPDHGNRPSIRPSAYSGRTASYRHRCVAPLSYAVDMPLTEQPFRPHQQEQQREHIREPAFDATEVAAEGILHHRRDVDLGQLLGSADDESAHDSAGNRGKAPEDQHRQGLQRRHGQRELHAIARAPQQARDQRHEPGHAPDHRPDMLQRDAQRQRRLVIVGHGAQRAAHLGLLEEQRQRRHQDHHHARGKQVELGDADTDAVHHRLDRFIDDAQVDGTHLAAEQQGTQPFEEEGQADGGHEQRDGRLVDQLAQHETFGGQPHQDHHHEGADDGRPHRHALVHQAHHRQRGKVDHGALGEIEHARGLVDQYEAQRHQRIHQAGQQATERHFEEELHIVSLPLPSILFLLFILFSDFHPARLHAQCEVPRQALITSGLLITSSGVPSPIFLPQSSTTTRSEISITTPMSCSIRTMVVPNWSFTSSTKRHMSCFSSTFMPAMGSSSSSMLGSAASARASSTRFCSPQGRRPTGVLRICWISRKSITSSTLRRCSISSLRAAPHHKAFDSRPERILVLRPVMMLSSTVMPLNRAIFWKVRAMPWRAIALGGMPRRDWPRQRMLPFCGWQTPLMTLIIELLPAPLGPMMARISCSRTSKEISVRARTPPKDSEMFCRSRMTSPMRRPVAVMPTACSSGLVTGGIPEDRISEDRCRFMVVFIQRWSGSGYAGGRACGPGRECVFLRRRFAASCRSWRRRS